MDIFTKKRWTAGIIILLLLFNCMTLFIIWIRVIQKPDQLPGTRRESESNLKFLREELQLTEDQFIRYQELQQQHHEQIRILNQQMHHLKQRRMEEIFKEKPDTLLTNRQAQEIGELQSEIEVLAFKHFMDLKQLCGEDQQQKLRALLDEFFRRTRPPEPAGPEKPGEYRPPPRRPPPPQTRQPKP